MTTTAGTADRPCHFCQTTSTKLYLLTAAPEATLSHMAARLLLHADLNDRASFWRL